jgi:hypothetical protein
MEKAGQTDIGARQHVTKLLDRAGHVCSVEIGLGIAANHGEVQLAQGRRDQARIVGGVGERLDTAVRGVADDQCDPLAADLGRGLGQGGSCQGGDST